MDDEKTEAVTPDEVFDNLKSMSKNEKIRFLTDLPSKVIEAITELVKTLDKADERVSALVKSRNDALLESLKEGEKSVDEKERIIALVDEGIKIEVESKDKGYKHKENMVGKVSGVAGGIALIVSGTYVAIKGRKKTGYTMIASGAALIGITGSETKIVKALMDSLNDTQEEDFVEA